MRSKLYIAKVAPEIKLLSVQINVTNKCPCKCDMCHKYEWPKIELSAKQFIERLNEFRDVDSIVLSGGEPLMYTNLEAVKFVEKPLLGMFTCGVGKFSDNYDLLKLFTWIRVSIDGFGATHDRIRGARIFDRAIEFAKEIKLRDIDTRIQFTIQQSNYQEFVSFVNYSIENLGIPCFGFFAQGKGELTIPQKFNLLHSLLVFSGNEEILKNSNVSDLISQLTSIPYRAEKCIIPYYHRVIDSDNTMWPCCYTMADNCSFERRDLKYECSEKVDAEVWEKRTQFCYDCDMTFSRYQRINEEYELLKDVKKRAIFL